MSISEKKMQIVIDNYFKSECDVNTSIRQAFEKGFRIGVKKGQSADRPKGKWVEQKSDHIEKIYLCSNCENYEAWGETEKTPYCPNCGAKMEVSYE